MVAFVALACRAPRSDTGGELPRSETFYVGGRQWGAAASFNPLSSSPDWPVNAINLLYETLLVFDPLTGKLCPLLASSYDVHEDSIVVTLNPGAHWNDGRPVTAWDVEYTFTLGKHHKTLSVAPLWQYLTDVVVLDAENAKAPSAPVDATAPRRVAFLLEPKLKNPFVVLDALQDVRIVPRHHIEPLLAKVGGRMNEFEKLTFETEAVTSGPYRLMSVSGESIVTIRDDGYWGNRALHQGRKPIPKYIVHPIYKDNSHFSVALRQGRIDASSTFVPRIWRKREKGVRAWFDAEPYYVGDSMPMLFINVKRAPLGDARYRRAMGFAINYKDIRELAASGYSEPLRPGLILPFGREARFFSEQDAKRYGTYFDPERAKAELKRAGYTATFDARGELQETRDAGGKKVPTAYVKSPAGWSDWESMVRIAVKGMRAVGIDVRERFIDPSLFWEALYRGEFDLIMCTPDANSSPSKPWSRFELVMTSRDFAPEGEKMFKNVGRFNDPSAPSYLARIDELLNAIPVINDERALAAAYAELNRIFMQEQPTLPLVYRPDQFYEFSVKHWINLATAKNPYAPPQVPGDRLGTWMLWSIRPVEPEGS